MKFKKKGKIYSSRSSSSSSSSYKDPDCALKLLPLTIVALAIALPAQYQEVVAYMITRFIFTAATKPFSEKKSKYRKRKPNQTGPLFECGCFDCYTSFWYRWNSSPNRDLIHQVIEAFEEHLLQNESPKKQNKGKKKGKVVINRFESTVMALDVPEKELDNNEMPMPETESGNLEENGDECEEYKEEQKVMTELITGELEMEVVTVQVLQAPLSSRKGLATKVLEHVLGLLNSRLYSLWSPSI